MKHQLIILGCDMHRAAPPGDYLGSFSSHAAAFEAMCRLHNPNYQPLGTHTHFTPGDVRTMARVRTILGA